MGIVSGRKWGENLRREESTSVVAVASSIYMSRILDTTRISRISRDIPLAVLEIEGEKSQEEG